ncbi:AAA family ATPase [Gordonia polyisoprenivorans]|uniref:AAA family ATPase n=1 Tax=Gordonia polyisoprenivorans TaxID=84595 RepID=UPI001AD60B54|nr:AAA family ATPase [Gordonia polyisoprenivorans]QTI67400.1 AAA family ATPase [Gordonia polyisoprenivorans]
MKRADVLNDFRRDYGDRRGYVCIGHVRDRDPVTKKGTWGQDFFQYPDRASDAASRVVELVKAGRDVYKPTSLCESDSRSGPTIASNVISFEVDELADDEAATDLLRAVGATITDSGTEGHFHVRVMLDRDLDHDELKDLGTRLYRKLGVVDGGKAEPNGVLRITSTFNFKHDPPRPVAIGKNRVGTTVEALNAILADVPREAVADTGGAIDIAPMDLGALSLKARTKVRTAYSQIHSAPDVSKAFWRFWMTCAEHGVPVEQARGYDPDDLMPDRWAEGSRDEQVLSAYAAKNSATPRGKRSAAHKKGNKGVPDTKNTGSEDRDGVYENPIRLRRLNEVDEQIFEPIGEGLFEGAVTVLLGGEESAKTTLTLHILAALATGSGWAPWDIPPGEPRRVVLIATEPSMVATRLKLLGVPEDSPYLVMFSDNSGADFPMFPNDEYTDALVDFRPDFVAIDMWADSVEKLNLKNPQESLQAMSTWVRFATATGAGVLLLAHTNRGNGQATEAREVYGLTLSLRKKARATLFSYIDPEDGCLYTGVEKTNLKHPKTTHRFELAEVDTGLQTKRGKAITVAQLVHKESLPVKVWDQYVDARKRAAADAAPDRERMTAAKALVQVLSRGRTPRPKAIIETNEVLAEHKCAAVSPRSVDSAWQKIVDEGQAGQGRRNDRREMLWSLSYADHDRDDDCSSDD